MVSLKKESFGCYLKAQIIEQGRNLIFGGETHSLKADPAFEILNDLAVGEGAALGSRVNELKNWLYLSSVPIQLLAILDQCKKIVKGDTDQNHYSKHIYLWEDGRSILKFEVGKIKSGWKKNG